MRMLNGSSRSKKCRRYGCCLTRPTKMQRALSKLLWRREQW